MTPEDWSAVVLSVRVAASATALALAPGVAVGWVLARSRSRWATVLDLVSTVPLVLPPVVTGYVLLLVLPRSVSFTWWASVFASAVVGFPLLVQVARVGFEGVDRTLEDVARAEGAGRLDTFRLVTLPLAAPAVAAGAALHVARGLGEFGATIVVAGNIPERTQTLPLALYARLHRVDGEAASVRLAVAAVVLTVLSLALHRWLLSRFGGRDGAGP